MSDEKTITFGLAEPKDSKDYKGSSQTVEILTEVAHHCSRCKTKVLGEPMTLHMVDAISSEERHKAQRAVAVAMQAAHTKLRGIGQDFDTLTWTQQSDWLRSAVRGTGWDAEDYDLDAVGLGLEEKVRAAGIAEAQKWSAYTDKRKIFRPSVVKLPAGWLTLSFEARGSKDGQPVRHGNVMVHVCPQCAPAIFDAANVDPVEPFGDGVKW